MTRKRVIRTAVAISLVASGAYLCTSGPLACGSLGAEGALSAIDFCFMFDCTNGAVGGLIDPCAIVGVDPEDTTSDAIGTYGGPLFADCVNVEETDE